MNDCESWLLDQLKRVQRASCDTIRDAAKKAGFTKRDLKEARKNLNVGTRHETDPEDWFWYLRRG